MKYLLTFVFLISNSLNVFAINKDSVIYYALPDSVRATSFLVEFSAGSINTKKEVFAGIQTDIVKLSLESDKKEREVVFEFPRGSGVMATGIGIKSEKDELRWTHTWKENQNYRLMISTAGDSAGNFALYSGYVFLPAEKKWKLIGTCKIPGQWTTLKRPSAFCSENKFIKIDIHEAWVQRSNGTWRDLLQANFALPVVNLYSHVDSVEQAVWEKRDLEFFKQSTLKLSNNSPNAAVYREYNDIYYEMIKEGNGRQVSINDTVVAFYKGYLFFDNSVFDETKDKPATFPLNRLIRGWQIGVPLCKVGGKIKLIIPSNLAYSIRTRSAKIPPNSILVFEIEVVDAKARQ